MRIGEHRTHFGVHLPSSNLEFSTDSIMRKHILTTTLALSIAAALPGGALIPHAHAQAAPAASMVSPNRYGLPDFGDLVEQVGPAVVKHPRGAAQYAGHDG